MLGREEDRVFCMDEFKQFDQLNKNTNSRIPIFFCIDVSGSMNSQVNLFETRISLLSKVMKKMLEKMKSNSILSEKAVISVVTYNNRAFLKQTAIDLGVLDIERVTNFTTEGQTIFSLGLRRTLQAIDQYQDSVWRGDVDTFTPMLVFMTDGEPVGDDINEIRSVYQEVWNRVETRNLYVFSIGISGEAKMDYVEALDPDHRGYKIIDEDDFKEVFTKIERIVGTKKETSSYFEEHEELSYKVSEKNDTRDTSVGRIAQPDDLAGWIIDKNTRNLCE